MLLIIGVVLALAGAVLLLNVGGAAETVIRRVTSRSLGELAPGFAATRAGFNVYATLVLAVGACAAGLGIAGGSALLGAGLLVAGAITFVVASVVAVVGEVRTYRSLRAPRRG